MKIFNEQAISDLFQSQRKSLIAAVEAEQANYLLNVNETLYVNHLIATFAIEPLNLDLDNVEAATSEREIPAETLGKSYFMVRGRSFEAARGRKFKMQVVTFHVPAQGNVELLRYQPSRYIMWTTEVQVEDAELRFEIINLDNNTAHVKQEMESILGHIRQQWNYLHPEVAAFNLELEGQASQAFHTRRRRLLEQQGVVAQLGVPIRRTENVSPTFAIPNAPKRVIIKPPASTEPFAPEPTLDEASYFDIIKVIGDFGRELERHPSVYNNKDEEALRDLFLMLLSPHFQSVSGETFNKKGKTDILIRHEGHNVFVAECKIWNGASEFSKALDQLLSYLTWRDSKTALLIFVRNAQIAPVLASLQKAARAHPCFVGADDEKSNQESGHFAFEFHLPGDSSRSVRVMAMAFHLT